MRDSASFSMHRPIKNSLFFNISIGIDGNVV